MELPEFDRVHAWRYGHLVDRGFERVTCTAPQAVRRVTEAFPLSRAFWATGYPHPDGFFPGAPDMVRKKLSVLSDKTMQQEMPGGAKGIYG